MEMAVRNIDSTVIRDIEYVGERTPEAKGTVTVTFQNGSVYVYESVYLMNVMEMLNAESIGSYFGIIFRPSYTTYRKVA